MHAMTARASSHLTLRKVPSDLVRALRAEQRRRGKSLNQTVIDALRRAFALDAAGPRRNGLERFAGTWRDSDVEQFEAATAPFEQIDAELWR